MVLRWDLWMGFSEHVEIKKHPLHFVLPRVILLTKDAQTWCLGEQLSLVTPPSLHPLLLALFMAVLSLRLASSCSGAAKYRRQRGLPPPPPPKNRLFFALPFSHHVMCLSARSASLHQRLRGEYNSRETCAKISGEVMRVSFKPLHDVRLKLQSKCLNGWWRFGQRVVQPAAASPCC